MDFNNFITNINTSISKLYKKHPGIYQCMVMMVVDPNILENNGKLKCYGYFNVVFNKHILFDSLSKTKNGSPTHMLRILKNPRACTFEKETGYFYNYCEYKYTHNSYSEIDCNYVSSMLYYIVTEQVEIDWSEAAVIWKTFLQKFSDLVGSQYLSISNFLEVSILKDLLLKLEEHAKVSYINPKSYCYEAARIMLCLEAVSVQLTKEEKFIPRTRKYVSYYPMRNKEVLVDYHPMQLTDAEIMRTILDFDEKFNKSESIQKIYRNLDVYCRNMLSMRNKRYRNIYISDDQKRIRKFTDIGSSNEIVAYLTFFETMFLILKNCINSFQLINDLFKYRFILIVNNPYVQEQEIFPFRSTYNNIFNFYKYWKRLEATSPRIEENNEIYMPFNDLAANYAIYKLMNSDNLSTTFQPYSKYYIESEFVIRKCNKSDVKALFSLYNSSADKIIDMVKSEISTAIDHDAVWEIEQYDKAVAVAMIFTNLEHVKNIDPRIKVMDACMIDAIFVEESYRGLEFQNLFLSLANHIAKNKNIFAKVKPDNEPAIRNLRNFGFKKYPLEFGTDKPKYDYYWFQNFD